MAGPFEQDVPKGPLAVRWLGLELGDVRAGAVTRAAVELQNVGTAAWRSVGEEQGVRVSYHWLDGLGNPIVWDGLRGVLEEPVPPGGRARCSFDVLGPIPPGRYLLALDVVDEGRTWLSELGSPALERVCDVGPRIPRALAARGGDAEALAAQEEPLVPEDEAAAVAYLADGVAPASDWSRRVLDAHQEGYGVVAGAVEASGGLLRRSPKELEPYAPGAGRVPGFGHPLVCPSAVKDVQLDWADPVAGLPTVRTPRHDSWLYDGRIRVRLRSGRPRG
jgi:hypothetical protein